MVGYLIGCLLLFVNVLCAVYNFQRGYWALGAFNVTAGMIVLGAMYGDRRR